MNKTTYTLLIALMMAICPAVMAQNATDADDGIELLVPVPTPPEHLTTLSQRCNYILDHYWDNFNFKTAMSARKRFDKTFGTFLDFTPYASADTVMMVIDRLTTGMAKAKPEYLIDLAETAAKWTQGDTAEYQSDQLYTPFVRAVVNNKKIKGPQKARYQAQLLILESSSLGSRVPDLAFTDTAGVATSLYTLSKAPHKLIVIFDPDCADCRLSKARLSADYIIESLIDNNIIDLVALYPGEPDDELWQTEQKTMPKNWIVGAAPDIDRYFNLDKMPAIYYLDKDFDVMAKNVQTNNILEAFRNLLQIMQIPD